MSSNEISFPRDALATLEKIAERFSDKRRLLAAIERSFARSALIVAGGISRSMTAGGTLRRRTGSLARSVIGKSDYIGGLPGMRIGIFTGPALAYAAVQEFGAEIKPKKPGGFLAVPVDGGGGLTPAGVARYESARQYPRELVFARGRFKARLGGKEVTAGAALLDSDRRFKDFMKHARPVYLLLRKVNIRPKKYLRNGLSAALPLVIARLQEDLLKELANG